MRNDGSMAHANFSGIDADETPPAGMDIRAVISGMLRRWPIIAGTPVLFLVIAFGIAKIIPPVYKAGVQVLIFDPQRSNMGAMAEPSQPVRELDAVAINTEIEVIKSAALSLRVAQELRLDQNPEFQQRQKFAWLRRKIASFLSFSGISQSADDISGTPFVGSLNQLASGGGALSGGENAAAVDPQLVKAAAILNKHVTVDRVPLSYVIVVSATSQNPKTAQILATQIVNDYVADQKEISQKALSQLSVWLKAKLAELKPQMDDTSTEIEKLKVEVGADEPEMQLQTQRQIAELSSQLTAARTDLSEKRARLGGQAGRSAGTPAELQSNYDSALRREQSLEANLQRLRATQGAAATNVRLQELQRIADANGKLYDTYSARLNEVENSLTLSSPGKRIISDATVPSDPASPPVKLLVMGGGALGLVVGIMLAFAITQLKAGILPGGGAEHRFGYPIIGNVPLFQNKRASPSRQVSVRDNLLTALGGMELSPHSEAARMIRMSMRSWNLDRTPKVILVTSAVPGEGKSTIATLLAAASAGARQRAVLVDCDFYGRTVSGDTGSQRLGLADLLMRTAGFDDVVYYDQAIGCSVIPAGSSFHRRGDLLVSAAMAETVTRLREEFDYVVIDTPPLLSVADALGVAALVDKVVVVVDAGGTRPEIVKEALRLLRSGRDRVAGIVLNKVQPNDLQRIGMYAYAYSSIVDQPALPRPTDPHASTGIQSLRSA